MSDLYVRSLATSWAEGQALPFFSTINEEQEAWPQQWFTLDFRTFGRTPETYCSEVETGQVVLVFFGQPGVGFVPLMQAAEPVVKAYFESVDPAGRLTLENVGPPSDDAILDAPWYAVEYPIAYTFR